MRAVKTDLTMFMKNAKGSELGKVDGRRQRGMKNL
jgi:hypothetical protein